MRPFQVGSHQLLLVHSNNQTHIIENRCPHQDAPLTQATLVGDTIRCSRHGIEFNLLTGRATNCPNTLKFITPTYEGNQIGVML